MTPERWQRIAELFEAAVLRDAAGRESWLRAASGGDADLRAEVERLLSQDGRAERDGILSPPATTRPPSDRTESWLPRVAVAPRDDPRPIAPAAGPSVDRTGGFTPREAIAPHTGDTRSPSRNASCGRGCANCR